MSCEKENVLERALGARGLGSETISSQEAVWDPIEVYKHIFVFVNHFEDDDPLGTVAILYPRTFLNEYER